MRLLAEEERRADWVLGLMLPRNVIQVLKSGSTHCAATFKEASVLFVEIADFALLGAALPASELVELLNFVFTTFDDALEDYGPTVYKVETVGAVYVVSAGVPEPRPDHCKVLTLLALSLHGKLAEALKDRPDFPQVRCKMGLQSGPVVGGVIGLKHPRYRLFGDIVNTAARMETRGEPGRLHVAEAAAELLKKTGMFQLVDRGEMAVKGKGVMRTYFVEGFAADAVEAGRLKMALVRISYKKAMRKRSSQLSTRARKRWVKMQAAQSFVLLGSTVHAKRVDLVQGMRDFDSMDFDGWVSPQVDALKNEAGSSVAGVESDDDPESTSGGGGGGGGGGDGGFGGGGGGGDGGGDKNGGDNRGDGGGIDEERGKEEKIKDIRTLSAPSARSSVRVRHLGKSASSTGPLEGGLSSIDPELSAGADFSSSAADDGAGGVPDLSPEEAAAVRIDARLALQQTSTSVINLPHASPKGDRGGGGRVEDGTSGRDGVLSSQWSGRKRFGGSSAQDSDPVQQHPWSLQFTQVEIEREYFAMQWGSRRRLLRRAVPIGATVAAATVLW